MGGARSRSFAQPPPPRQAPASPPQCSVGFRRLPPASCSSHRRTNSVREVGCARAPRRHGGFARQNAPCRASRLSCLPGAELAPPPSQQSPAASSRRWRRGGGVGRAGVRARLPVPAAAADASRGVASASPSRNRAPVAPRPAADAVAAPQTSLTAPRPDAAPPRPHVAPPTLASILSRTASRLGASAPPSVGPLGQAARLSRVAPLPPGAPSHQPVPHEPLHSVRYPPSLCHRAVYSHPPSTWASCGN
mmetsp:Transcript_14675/g.24990  ORF Transcript_14675/g.24990 Transcript_14675/m.24990 type:complete len:249 (-) Transcript_14675:263-1009(-)